MLQTYIGFAFVILCFAFALLREGQFSAERTAWAEERRELLNRIQAPHLALPDREYEPITLTDEDEYQRELMWRGEGSE